MRNEILSEKQALKYARELERKNQELQDFVFIASHDLQDPLRKIISFGDQLKSILPDLDGRGQNYLDRLQNTALGMRSLLDSLLELARVETMSRPFEATDLNALVNEALRNLESRIYKTKGKVNIKSLPVVEADPNQMCQLFQNLIGNALKYKREGVVPIVNLESHRMETGVWKIIVEDNGIGINEKYAERIFKPFERLHGKSQYKGNGMGLSICKKIMVRHNGDITVQSRLNKGAKFIITIPEKRHLDCEIINKI